MKIKTCQVLSTRAPCFCLSSLLSKVSRAHFIQCCDTNQGTEKDPQQMGNSLNNIIAVALNNYCFLQDLLLLRVPHYPDVTEKSQGTKMDYLSYLLHSLACFRRHHLLARSCSASTDCRLHLIIDFITFKEDNSRPFVIVSQPCSTWC